MGQPVEREERIVCPWTGTIEPHRLYISPDQIIAWCQTCYMVHVYPSDGSPPILRGPSDEE